MFSVVFENPFEISSILLLIKLFIEQDHFTKLDYFLSFHLTLCLFENLILISFSFCVVILF